MKKKLFGIYYLDYKSELDEFSLNQEDILIAVSDSESKIHKKYEGLGRNLQSESIITQLRFKPEKFMVINYDCDFFEDDENHLNLFNRFDTKEEAERHGAKCMAISISISTVYPRCLTGGSDPSLISNIAGEYENYVQSCKFWNFHSGHLFSQKFCEMCNSMEKFTDESEEIIEELVGIISLLRIKPFEIIKT